MYANRWKLLVLVAAVAVAGCDIEDRLRSLLYEDADSPVPTADGDQQGDDRRMVEPATSPSQATPIQVDGQPDPVFASLDSPDDTHWFSLQGSDDEELVVDLGVEPQNDQLDVVLHLEVPVEGEAPLRYDIAGAGELEEIPLVAVDAGEQMRFSVSSGGETTGEYRIDTQQRLMAATIATTPGDVPAVAQTLELPGEIQGFYDRPHDRDIFFVPADSLRAGVYSLQLSNIPGLQQRLEIYDDDQLDDPILQLDVDEQTPAAIPNLSLDGSEGEQDGLYFSLTARGDGYDREEGYQLRIVEHPDDDDEEFTLEREPNDTEQTAQRVELDEPIRGYFHTPEDVDRFRFDIERPDNGDDHSDEADSDDATEEEALHPRVRQALERHDDIDPGEFDSLDELQEAGIDIVDPWQGIEPRDAPDHVVQATLTPLGDAHRMAMRWIPQEDDDTRLEAEDEQQQLVFCTQTADPGEVHVELAPEETDDGFRPRSFDYEFEVSNIAGMPGLEVEPNDEPEQANRLESTQPRRGLIGREGDVDYYAFVVGDDAIRIVDDDPDDEDDGDDGWEQFDTERVELTLEGNPLDLGFELIDDEGGRVADVDDGGPGANEQLQIDLPHGLYYVAVRAASGTSCEPYQLELTTQ